MEMDVRRLRAARVKRTAKRGVTLVEVLIVLSIMALISGGAVLFVFPEFAKAKVKTTRLVGQQIRQATLTYMNVDGINECPTVQDLTTAKKLEPGRSNDPWGKPYKINCADGEIRVISSGKDGKEGTPDDVPDNLSDKDIPKIADM